MAIVYQHRRKDTNEVFYIGIGKTEKRAISKSYRNNHWHHIVNKAGYIIEIIHHDLTWLEACEKEIYLIAFYGRADLGLGSIVNMTSGGEGILGYKFSDESRKKMRKPRSEEAKANISKGQKGRIFSEEHCKKISEARKGQKTKPHSKESIKRMLETKKGTKYSEESKAKMRGHKEIVECPHCHKEGGIGIMKRWHFNNCKKK